MGALITMTAVTGKPSRERIFEYLRGLCDNGIEQAMLYPRSGCELEYLSEEWFTTIGDFIEIAKELGMGIWLYDDFNWPSGDACGRVTAIPDFRLRAISTRGKNAGCISCKSRHNSGLFGEKFFPNLLSSDAVDYFIKCTHEEYFKRFGSCFGTVIKGMFTDEPSIGYCCESDSIPYYEGIEADYFELCGRDFNSDMLECEEDFYTNAITVISKRFNRCYISKIASWCKEHGILMAGHLMCDDSFTGATRHSGKMLKNLSCFSLPGIDEIHSIFADFHEMALFGAIEYARGENGAMAELFALGPCDMPYSKRRCMLYLSACHGIDHYFLAISHLDMRGNLLVTDYFNNFNTDQPDFAGMRLLASEAELASALAKRAFVPDVYVRYPFSASVRGIAEGFDLECLYSLINELTYRQIQWKFIDDEAPCDAPIIELDSELNFTIDGEALDLSKICHTALVIDQNGDTPKGIFVRRFTDGGFVILNLFAPSGEYLINGERAFIDEYAVITSLDTGVRASEEILPKFKVSYSNDNVIRTMHINSVADAIINCDKDRYVTFFVRNGTLAFLNGEKITASSEATVLSRGMRYLYKMSDRVLIKQGESIVTTEKDFKYLPSVLISGDFSCEVKSGETCPINLSERACEYSCGERLYDYGKIELVTEAYVPHGATAIELSGTRLYTLVYANGVLLGERAFAPYSFSLNAGLCGDKITLKIVQYSSIAPIFGDVAYWDKTVEHSQWRGTPSTERTAFGFDKIKWVF